jgi:uncharacterized protein (TIGR03067 family)
VLLTGILVSLIAGCPGRLGKEGSKRTEPPSDTAPKDTTTGKDTALPQPGNTVEDDKLLGTWREVQVIADGVDKTADVLKNDSRLTFHRGGKLTPVINGQQLQEAYRLPGAGHVDVTFNGQYRPGIYKIEGTKLTICVSLTSNTRPTEFVAPRESGYILSVLERIP